MNAKKCKALRTLERHKFTLPTQGTHFWKEVKECAKGLRTVAELRAKVAHGYKPSNIVERLILGIEVQSA